jgi:hypothetical protein
MTKHTRGSEANGSAAVLTALRALIEHDGEWSQAPWIKTPISGAEEFKVDKESFNLLLKDHKMIGDGCIDPFMALMALEIGTFTYASPQRIAYLIEKKQWTARDGRTKRKIDRGIKARDNLVLLSKEKKKGW